MNDKIKALTGLSVGGFIALLALHGKALVDALMGFPLLVQAWSAALPMGVWSALLALALGLGAWSFCLHWLPNDHRGRRPELAAETMALLVAVAVTVLQQWGGTRGEVLTALWMGVAAGFLAPYLGKAIRYFTSSQK